MIDFKNVLKIPYIKFNFLLIIILLSLITLFGPIASMISLIFTSFLTVGLIGTNIIFNLKNYDSKTILKIIELTLVYFIASIIFLIFQAIFVSILFIPVLLLRANIDTFNFSSLNASIILLIIIFIVTLVGFLIIEFIKNIGFLRYLRSGKFEDFFNFKKNINIVFTKDFLINILFLIGYFILLIILFIVILSILTLIFNVYSNSLIGILIILFVYLVISSLFISFNEIYNAYK